MVALQTAKTTQETAMNHGTKTIALPELTANLLRDGGCLIDNLFVGRASARHVGLKPDLQPLVFTRRQLQMNNPG